MAETKVDKVAEQIERRDIRRNFSNQIISYGLPEDSNLKYGYKIACKIGSVSNSGI